MTAYIVNQWKVASLCFIVLKLINANDAVVFYQVAKYRECIVYDLAIVHQLRIILHCLK